LFSNQGFELEVITKDNRCRGELEHGPVLLSAAPASTITNGSAPAREMSPGFCFSGGAAGPKRAGVTDW
jgi:hypothetical protein